MVEMEEAVVAAVEDRICRRDAILASNRCSWLIACCAAATCTNKEDMVCFSISSRLNDSIAQLV